MKSFISDVSRKFLICILSVNVIFLGVPGVTFAGNIGTEAFLNSESAGPANSTRDRVNALLAKQEVADQMAAMGVDPALISERLATLSESELQSLEGRLNQLPAGGDVLALIGAVFVVLLILELVGVTNVFTRI